MAGNVATKTDKELFNSSKELKMTTKEYLISAIKLTDRRLQGCKYKILAFLVHIPIMSDQLRVILKS